MTEAAQSSPEKDPAAPPSAGEVECRDVAPAPEPSVSGADQATTDVDDGAALEAAAHNEIANAAAPFVGGLSADFASLGEPESARDALTSWLGEVQANRMPAAGEHGFDLRKWRSLKDQSMLASFATAMAAQGMSQEGLDSSVRRYLDLRHATQKGSLGLIVARLGARPSGQVRASQPDTVASADDEIKQIEKTMKENRRAYNADTAMQARYLELLSE